MVVVSEYLYSVFVFKHTLSTSSSDSVSIYKIYVVKQSIECKQILINWNIVDFPVSWEKELKKDTIWRLKDDSFSPHTE